MFVTLALLFPQTVLEEVEAGNFTLTGCHLLVVHHADHGVWVHALSYEKIQFMH